MSEVSATPASSSGGGGGGGGEAARLPSGQRRAAGARGAGPSGAGMGSGAGDETEVGDAPRSAKGSADALDSGGEVRVAGADVGGDVRAAEACACEKAPAGGLEGAAGLWPPNEAGEGRPVPPRAASSEKPASTDASSCISRDSVGP